MDILMILYLAIIAAGLGLLFLLCVLLSKNKSPIFESEAKRAGRAGERFATQKIQEILKDDDIHNVIHFGTDNNLSKRTVSRLADLLSRL